MKSTCMNRILSATALSTVLAASMTFAQDGSQGFSISLNGETLSGSTNVQDRVQATDLALEAGIFR